jgi:hypothetical protein
VLLLKPRPKLPSPLIDGQKDDSVGSSGRTDPELSIDDAAAGAATAPAAESGPGVGAGKGRQGSSREAAAAAGDDDDGGDGDDVVGEDASETEEDEDEDEDEAVIDELFEKFDEQLKQAGISMPLEDRIELFAQLYGQDEDDEDEDEESQDEEEEDEEEEAADRPGSATTSSIQVQTRNSSSSKQQQKQRQEPAGESPPAASGRVHRSSGSSSSSSSNSSSGAGQLPPSFPVNSAGWRQLSGLVGPEQLARLNDLMRADAIRIKELSQGELGILFQALHNLQQVSRRGRCAVADPLAWLTRLHD